MIKRAEDPRPWATIIIRAPANPQVELDNMPASISPMCPTEEYAISDFRSDCRMQINLVITAPVIDRLASIWDLR